MGVWVGPLLGRQMDDDTKQSKLHLMSGGRGQDKERH